MNLCYRRERTPPPPPPAVNKGGSTTLVGLIPPVPLDMVFRPDCMYCSVADAGENSTASTDRGRMADIFIASSPPPPPPVGVTPAVGREGSTTAVGLIPPVLLDLAFCPARSFRSGAGAGVNSTASDDRGCAADLFLASFLPAGVIRRVDPPFPAGHIRCRVLLSSAPKEPDGSHPPLGDRAGPFLNPYPPPLHNSVLHDRGDPFAPK